MIIQVDISRINTIAQNLLNEVEDLDTNIQKLSNVLDNISNDWKGQDATFFLQNMKNVNTEELNKLNTILKDYGTYLKKVPSIYSAMDEVYSEKNIG